MPPLYDDVHKASGGTMFRLVLLLIMAVVAYPQSPLGSITGTITDAQGARVPGVEVVATQTGTNREFRAKSSEEGTFTLPNLPIGPYTLTATAPGFKQLRRSDLNLEVAQRLRVDIVLEVGAIS